MIGTVLSGEYRVDKLIGSGGMAYVYRCVSLSTGRIVAVKVLREEHREDEEFRRRFQREARAGLSLSHPNIVGSLDVGEDQGRPYIVLEYVRGYTLKQLIRERGPLPVKQATDIACQLLRALEHAHGNGIIHRDVKPQNVLLDKRGVPKLADFGIARETDTTATFGDSVMGSVHYISPEQARGEEVGVRSDLYSLGVILYEMITGQVPFTGDTTVAIALKHLQEPMEPPIALRRHMPRALNDVILKATAKDPQLRYESAAAMSADVCRALREQNGRFARIRDKAQAARATRGPSGVLKVGLVLLLILSMFVMVFFTFRSLWQRSQATTLVPKLLGRTLEEAQQTARLRGYMVEVTGHIFDVTQPAGTVLSQAPEASTVAAEGTVIQVTVSSESPLIPAPSLLLLPWSDALDRLEALGLAMGEIHYLQTEDAPQGVVVQQSPAPDTELMEGDAVDVWINGAVVTGSLEMPSLANYTLADALAVLQERGMTSVRLRRQDAPGVQEGRIVTQVPSGGMLAQEDTLVELTVCGRTPGAYAAQVSLEVESPERNLPLVVALSVQGAQWVLYEETLAKKGVQTVEFTASFDVGGTHELVCYIDNQEVRRVTASFFGPEP